MTRRTVSWNDASVAMTTLAVSAVDLARIQFATTSIYHFFFVPLTLGLGPLVAVMQTMWHRTRDERWLRLTHFFGTLFLINFAIGVATGSVSDVAAGSISDSGSSTGSLLIVL